MNNEQECNKEDCPKKKDDAPKTVKIEVDLPVLPDGYEYTGEFKIPKTRDELFMDGDEMEHGESTRCMFRHIIRKVKKWRPAEFPRDWGKAARFRNNEDDEWESGTLHGCRVYNKKIYRHPYISALSSFTFCEVLED